MNLNRLNKNKWILRIANGLFIWVLFIILILFIIMNRYSDYQEVSEDFKRIIVNLNAPFIQGGIILTVGLLAMTIAKFFKSKYSRSWDRSSDINFLLY